MLACWDWRSNCRVEDLLCCLRHCFWVMASDDVPSLRSLAGAGNQTMSLNCKEKEQECVLLWFKGWSHHQKQDFLRFLLDRALPQNVDTLFEAMDCLSVGDKPPSIFQCQLKLMGEWFAEWIDKERNDFLIRLAAIDIDFVNRFNEEVMKAKQT